MDHQNERYNRPSNHSYGFDFVPNPHLSVSTLEGNDHQNRPPIMRTLNAQGRTETYTNVMPRYALFHIIYRLNKQPKSKVSK